MSYPEHHHVSPASYTCRDMIPSARKSSSRDAGWNALLLDIHSGVTSNEAYRANYTPDFRIGVTLAGEFACDAFSRGRWRPDRFSTGAIMLHHSREPTSYRFPRLDDQTYQLALIYLPATLLKATNEYLRPLGSRRSVPVFNSSVYRDPAVAAMAVALVQTVRNGGDNLYAEASANWLAVHLLTAHGLEPELNERSPGHITDARVTRVIEFMSARFGEQLTLDQLASEACVSKYHFTRLFKQKTGETPLRLLLDIRLAAAHRMLLSTDQPIAEISRTCGFIASSHFSSAFFAKYGLAPKALRHSSNIEIETDLS